MNDELFHDFDTLSLGDKRRNDRARRLLTSLSARPSAAPASVLSEAELEAFYRFVNNDSVTFESLLQAHRLATVARVGERDRVVVAHDTTDFRFADESPREGLGPMDNGGQGFYAHFSLAVGSGRASFGLVAVEAWTRASRTSPKKTQRERYADPKKESLRWYRGVEAAEKAFSGPRLIHVMDREADDYDILSALVKGNHGFVVRASFDRRLEGEAKRLKTFARQLEVKFERPATLSSRRKNRPAKQKKLYPARESRMATLALSAASVTLRRPDKSDSDLPSITLNVVYAHEPAPPEGCIPVEWILLTREPTQTAEQIIEVVDAYRARWVIEEYNKALKTGCSFEKRQNESFHALLNTLGIYLPIAWSLLNMRTLSRDGEQEKRPAAEVFTPIQLQLIALKAAGKLNSTPTIGEAVYLMARLFGGLQKSNGAPGWQTLGRAYERLLEAEVTWRLAMRVLGAASAEREK